MQKLYKIIYLLIMGLIFSLINSYAEFGSTSWIFPAAYKGALTEMGADAVFESVGANETPVVVVSAWDADTNTYLSQDASSGCNLSDNNSDLHPDQYYVGDTKTPDDGTKTKIPADKCNDISRNFNRGDVFEGFGFDPSAHTDPCEFTPVIDKPIMRADPPFITIAPVVGNYASGSIVVSDITISDTLMCQSSQSYQPDPITKTQVIKVHYDYKDSNWLYINGTKILGPIDTELNVSGLNLFGTPVPGSPSEFTFSFATTGMSVGTYHVFVTVAGFNSNGIIDTSNSPVCIEIEVKVTSSNPPCG